MSLQASITFRTLPTNMCLKKTMAVYLVLQEWRRKARWARMTRSHPRKRALRIRRSTAERSRDATIPHRDLDLTALRISFLRIAPVLTQKHGPLSSAFAFWPHGFPYKEHQSSQTCLMACLGASNPHACAAPQFYGYVEPALTRAL